MGSQDPCIYRVPSQLREVNPEAYRPRMLLIGPLTHSKKPKVHTDSRYADIAWTTFVAYNQFFFFCI